MPPKATAPPPRAQAGQRTPLAALSINQVGNRPNQPPQSQLHPGTAAGPAKSKSAYERVAGRRQFASDVIYCDAEPTITEDSIYCEICLRPYKIRENGLTGHQNLVAHVEADHAVVPLTNLVEGFDGQFTHRPSVELMTPLPSPTAPSLRQLVGTFPNASERVIRVIGFHDQVQHRLEHIHKGDFGQYASPTGAWTSCEFFAPDPGAGEFFAVCGACTQNTDKPNEDRYRM
ncbi:hypothetical protein JCM8115_002001 [Rhodotorula mucilaginosa]